MFLQKTAYINWKSSVVYIYGAYNSNMSKRYISRNIIASREINIEAKYTCTCSRI